MEKLYVFFFFVFFFLSIMENDVDVGEALIEISKF